MTRGARVGSIVVSLFAVAACGRRHPQRPVDGDRRAIKQIVTTRLATCARTAGGEVYCWGAIRIEPNDTGRYPTPTRVPGVVDAIELAADADRACIRDRSNHVMCLGANNPVDVDLAPGARAFAIGTADRCVITDRDTVRCVHGDESIRWEPVAGPSRVIQLVTRQGRSCARNAAGNVWCWGGGTVVAEPVSLVGPAMSITGDGYEWCALHADGRVGCWTAARALESLRATIDDATEIAGGAGGWNYVGLTSGTPRLICVRHRDASWTCEGSSGPPDGRALSGAGREHDFHDVSLGARHACALVGHTGRARCWGDTQAGQVGNGEIALLDRPRRVPRLNDVTRLFGGGQDFAAITRDGNVFAWGTHVRDENDRPMALRSFGAGIAEIAMLAGSICARRGSDDDWRCVNAIPDESRPEQLAVLVDRDRQVDPVMRPALQIGGAVNDWCALDREHHVQCMAALLFVPGARPVEGLVRDVEQLAVGSVNSCARYVDGSVACWSPYETMGVAPPSFIAAFEARPVSRLSATRAIAMGQIGWAIDRDRTVLGWEPMRDPIAVPEMRDIVQLAAGGGSACGVTRARLVRCAELAAPPADSVWGQRPADHAVVRDVEGLQDVAEVAMDDTSSCARRRDGSVWCWGDNRGDRLALGARLWTETPAEIALPDDARSARR